MFNRHVQNVSMCHTHSLQDSGTRPCPELKRKGTEPSLMLVFHLLFQLPIPLLFLLHLV